MTWRQYGSAPVWLWGLGLIWILTAYQHRMYMPYGNTAAADGGGYPFILWWPPVRHHVGLCRNPGDAGGGSDLHHCRSGPARRYIDIRAADAQKLLSFVVYPDDRGSHMRPYQLSGTSEDCEQNEPRLGKRHHASGNGGSAGQAGTSLSGK